ncbi:tripartite tricarboxylate transporter substrate-binding protein [Neoroseomonas oryzicola]|uniref:Tripartite tricarboxylate transporter substrate binding protein n=1 Tax=Neoroseomonas oryzicola TaxID=535904 RepID=A0A9X9WGP5_9PROT|nr:tripartite tricarboxylate transporter substrate binding protein [Neoroseomonas oryzicola]NKE16216.1 tripartite tricarboxylate transporter substrate binding protein [Neoroseomonas oryzicola]
MRRLLLAALAAIALAGPALAEEPARPIRWLVGLPAGSGPDLLTRLLAERLAPRLGRPIVVENRPGAAGNIAAAALARAPADGSTLGTLLAATVAINRHLYRDLGFDPARDFTPISHFASFPGVLLVNPSVPVETLAEFAAWARAQPQAPLCATGGAGVVPHLALAWLMREIGARCEFVHYRGSPEAQRDLIAGRVGVLMDGLPTSLPGLAAGRSRGVAVTSLQPSALAPDVPAIAASLPGFEALSWIAVGAPAGLPEPLAAQIEAAVAQAMQDPALLERFRALGVEPAASGRAALAARIAAEDARWGAVVRDVGITLD